MTTLATTLALLAAAAATTAGVVLARKLADYVAGSRAQDRRADPAGNRRKRIRRDLDLLPVLLTGVTAMTTSGAG